MPKNLTVGAGQVPLYPESDKQLNQIIYSWVPDQSDSLFNKMWGYQVQTRITLLPGEIQVQEVASSRFERAWQGFYATLSTLWGGKPEFTVSVLADEAIPANLSPHQTAALKDLLEQEELAADSINEVAIASIFGRVKVLLDTVTKPIKLEERIQSIKAQLPSTLKSGDSSWESSKVVIQKLAEDYFKEEPTSFIYSHADAILSLIAATLADEAFLQGPKNYMIAWSKKRGTSEEYRIPEDPARDFVSKIFL